MICKSHHFADFELLCIWSADNASTCLKKEEKKLHLYEPMQNSMRSRLALMAGEKYSFVLINMYFFCNGTYLRTIMCMYSIYCTYMYWDIDVFYTVSLKKARNIDSSLKQKNKKIQDLNFKQYQQWYSVLLFVFASASQIHRNRFSSPNGSSHKLCSKSWTSTS